VLPFAADFGRLILSFHNSSMLARADCFPRRSVRNHPENGTREVTSRAKSVKRSNDPLCSKGRQPSRIFIGDQSSRTTSAEKT
jgi:hypothetical protein